MKLHSVTFWYMDEWDKSEIETSHWPFRFIRCSGEKFANELSSFLEIFVQMHLKSTPLETIPLLNDFDELFLMKFSTYNLNPVYLFLCILGLSGKICKKFRNFFWTCGLQPFLKKRSCFKLQILSPILNLSFLFSCRGLLHCLNKMTKFLTFFGIMSIEKSFLKSRAVTDWDNLWNHLYLYSSM